MDNAPWVLVAGGFHRLGGMDKANIALLEYLVHHGRHVHIVSHSVEKDLFSNPSVTVHLVPRPLGSIGLGGPLLDWQGRRIAKQVTATNPKATVLVNGGNCIWPGINWAHYIHKAWRPGFDASSILTSIRKSLTHQLDIWLERTAYQKARLIIANSNLTRNQIINDIGINPDKVKTIYLGSDPNWIPATPPQRQAARHHFQIPQSRLQAVFVGALAYDNRKGLDTLFDAWQVLCSDPKWDVDLLIAGDGGAIPAWQAKIEKAGLADRIRILGFQNDIPDLLAATDILISPVRYEAYGLNVHEAVCCGLPAIVSESSGVAERYPQSLKQFLLSNPNDANELVTRLHLWRDNPEFWKLSFQPFGSLLRQHSWANASRDLVAAVTNQPQPASTGILQSA